MNDDPLIGQEIDQYRIFQYIASGGLADVYLASDIQLERQVALKIMQEGLLEKNPTASQRFYREARAAARLNHPHIVQVYSVGQTSAGRPYIAMQYITGGSLRDKLQALAERNKLLTPEQALNIARQIAEALAAAHNAGIIHRDLKPDNILIHPDGQPVLADLGMAAVPGGSKLTQTGAFLGTPYYMPPEQIQGKPLDGRADLYSLGVILYEMLAGRRPFAENDPLAVLPQHLYETPPPLENFCPDLAPQTINLVETALQKEPVRRFPRAEEMLLAIDRALQAEGIAEPNPQTTRVLATLQDDLLIDRPPPVYTQPEINLPPPVYQLAETDPAPRRKVPLWLMVTALTGGAVLLFFLLFNISDSGIDAAAVAAAITQTAVAQSETPAAAAALSETPSPPVATPDKSAQDIVTATAVPPTAVPLPSPTLEPTVPPTMVPTNTRPPTIESASIAPPTPTPCSIAVHTLFSDIWPTHSGELGCPVTNGKDSISLVQEKFRNGRMFWRKDNQRIYVLVDNGSWTSYADTWQDGDPKYSCGTPESPPTPKRGFGKFWCNFDEVRTGLGDALEAEWADLSTVQDFTGGLLLQMANGQTYIFYNNGTWR